MTAEAEELQRLHLAAERIAGSLVDLELDPGRQLLETSALDGESARRWAAAGDALSELWRRKALLEEWLERADAAQGSKQPGALRTLLHGPTIELTAAEVPLGARTLLGGTHTVERCSPHELIASMSSAFGEVKSVVCAIVEAWELLAPSIGAVRQLLESCSDLAAELGEPQGEELARAEQQVQRLGACATSDPLAIAAAEVDELRKSLRALNDQLEHAVALKRSFDARMLESRELLERLATATDEARRAHDETLLKISRPIAAPGHPVPDEVEAALARIVALAHQGAWREARHQLEAWTRNTRALLEEATRARDANRAPIEARNQFRGLLEAYQVKAKRIGLLEEPAVADAFARAHEALYTAPTDLTLAARLVRAYQDLLGADPPGLEPI